MASEPEPLLELRDLKTYFHTDEGVARSVDGVSYSIYPGKTLGGCYLGFIRQEFGLRREMSGSALAL